MKLPLLCLLLAFSLAPALAQEAEPGISAPSTTWGLILAILAALVAILRAIQPFIMQARIKEATFRSQAILEAVRNAVLSLEQEKISAAKAGTPLDLSTQEQHELALAKAETHLRAIGQRITPEIQGAILNAIETNVAEANELKAESQGGPR